MRSSGTLRMKTHLSLGLACFALACQTVHGATNSVVEFDPKETQELGWSVVDDGVMGGLSRGSLAVTTDGVLKFSGNLSLENNGGFSSLRTDDVKFDLGKAEGLVARVKGDGRTYQVRFGTETRYRGMEVSFMAEFPTEKDQWVEVRIPFNQFEAGFRGIKLTKEKFNPAQIRRLGLLLGDKREGPFELQVDWIRTYGSALIDADVRASNGVIHAVDAVLLPRATK